MAAGGEVGAWFITLAIHASIFTGVLIIFGYFRRHPLFRKFYAAKRYAVNVKTRKPDKLDNSLFKWIRRLISYNETDIAEIAGMDALMYIRLQNFGLELIGVITLLSAVIIIPVNLAGGVITDEAIINQPPPGPPPGEVPPPPPPPPLPPAPQGIFDNATYKCQYEMMLPPQASVSYLDRITMSNIPRGSNLLWAHLVVCVIIVFYALRLIFKYNIRCVAARLAYLGSVEPGAEANTVLVQDIPGMQTGSILDKLMRIVQGPLSIITPHKVSVAIEEKVAKTFGVGFGLKIPRTKAARLRQEAEQAAQRAAAEEIEPQFVSSRTAGPSFSAGPAAPGSPGFVTPRKMSRLSGDKAEGAEEAGKEAEPVNLPDVVVMLDGKELHAQDPNAPAEPADDFSDAESNPSDADQPQMITQVRSITDLKALEKELLAFGRARELLEGKSVEELVLAYFKEIYGEDVACVNVIPAQKGLTKVIRKYKATSQALDDLLNVYLQALKRKQQIKLKAITVHPRLHGDWCTSRLGTKKVKVEAIAWYVANLEKLRDEIAEGQLEADVTAEPAAFITFKSRVAQTIASTALQDHDTSAWTVAPAPGPDELVWGNIGMRAWLRAVRSLLVNAAYVSLIFFYGIPTTIFQGYLNAALYPILPPVLAAFLPGVVLMVFLAILPSILGFLALIRGAQSQSRIQWEMVERYFPFQVVVVFIFQLFGQLASNLLEFTTQLATQPQLIFELLAAYAPRQSFFFTSYILVKGLSGRTVQLINPGPLAVFWLKSTAAVTPQAKSRVLDGIFFQYGAYIPYDTITLLLGLTFAVQNPMLPFVCFLYFCTGLLVARYNLMYVYSQEFQSGGAVWPTVVNQVFVCLLVFEIFMAGMFSLYEAAAQSLIMFILIPVTVVFWANLSAAFNRPQKVMSMTAAAKMDRDQGKLDWAPERFQQVYTPPVMRDITEEHEEIMEQADSVLARLSGMKYYQEFKGLKEIPEPAPSASSSRKYRPPSPGSASMDSDFMDARAASFQSCVSHSHRSMQSIAPELDSSPERTPSRSNKKLSLAHVAAAAAAAAPAEEPQATAFPGAGASSSRSGSQKLAGSFASVAAAAAAKSQAAAAPGSESAKESDTPPSADSVTQLLGETAKAVDKKDA